MAEDAFPLEYVCARWGYSELHSAHPYHGSELKPLREKLALGLPFDELGAGERALLLRKWHEVRGVPARAWFRTMQSLGTVPTPTCLLGVVQGSEASFEHSGTLSPACGAMRGYGKGRDHQQDACAPLCDCVELSEAGRGRSEIGPSTLRCVEQSVASTRPNRRTSNASLPFSEMIGGRAPMHATNRKPLASVVSN
jgi:hypothetical protein